LKRALKGVKAWVTGLRREQNPTRAGLQKVEIDEVHGGVLKINPLADWTRQDVWRYVRERNLPYNALYDRGFKSIGCAPCTRPVGPNEPERAGRWWWDEARERTHPRRRKKGGGSDAGLHRGHRRVSGVVARVVFGGARPRDRRGRFVPEAPMGGRDGLLERHPHPPHGGAPPGVQGALWQGDLVQEGRPARLRVCRKLLSGVSARGDRPLRRDAFSSLLHDRRAPLRLHPDEQHRGHPQHPLRHEGRLPRGAPGEAGHDGRVRHPQHRHPRGLLRDRVQGPKGRAPLPAAGGLVVPLGPP